MRKEFSEWIEAYTKKETKSIFLTGDLGFGALEKVKESIKDRFVNMGVSEQNMITVSAALAQQGLLPICYSIAPFAVFRPYEQIRLDIAIHNLPVKIIGNGGGYGYGIMGATHHALEDLAVLSCLPNFKCVVPLCNSDVQEACESLFNHNGPGYLRLGFGIYPSEILLKPKFAACRLLSKSKLGNPKLTIVGIGPITLNIMPFINKYDFDLFVISEIPILNLDPELCDSINQSKRILVIEEHSARGGLAENLSLQLAKAGLTAYKIYHQFALGYPSGRYGSQEYHRQQSGLDKVSLENIVANIVDPNTIN